MASLTSASGHNRVPYLNLAKYVVTAFDVRRALWRIRSNFLIKSLSYLNWFHFSCLSVISFFPICFKFAFGRSLKCSFLVIWPDFLVSNLFSLYEFICTQPKKPKAPKSNWAISNALRLSARAPDLQRPIQNTDWLRIKQSSAFVGRLDAARSSPCKFNIATEPQKTSIFRIGRSAYIARAFRYISQQWSKLTRPANLWQASIMMYGEREQRLCISCGGGE